MLFRNPFFLVLCTRYYVCIEKNLSITSSNIDTYEVCFVFYFNDRGLVNMSSMCPIIIQSVTYCSLYSENVEMTNGDYIGIIFLIALPIIPHVYIRFYHKFKKLSTL